MIYKLVRCDYYKFEDFCKECLGKHIQELPILAISAIFGYFAREATTLVYKNNRM